MSGAAPTYREDTASAGEVLAHLRACEASFRPPLATRVDLEAYAAKISGRARTFEAWEGGGLAGLVAMYVDPAARTAFVTSVSVLPDLTGRGIARRLMERCLAHARGTGAATVALEVSEEAERAVALYAALGFEERGREGRTLRMALELGGGPAPDAGRSTMRDHNQEYQDNAGRKYAYGFDGVVRRYLLRTVAPHLVLDGTTLELGCFRGDMTEQILAWVPRLTVVEAASELAEVVRSRFPGRVEVVTSTFEEASLPEAAFDNVFLVHTLEHLDDPVGVLARIRGWLSPRGRLVVAVPNANALSRQLAVRMGLVAHNAAVTPPEAAHGHRRTYSLDVLLHHLGSAGLRVVDHGGVVLKPLANFQFDRALEEGIVDEAYLEACNALAKTYPDLSASVWAVCAAR